MKGIDQKQFKKAFKSKEIEKLITEIKECDNCLQGLACEEH